MVRRSIGVLFVCGLLVACGTPPEIKQLSTAQIGYFDTAIAAVKVQSETVLLLAQKVVAAADAKIAATEQQQLDALKQIAVKTVPDKPADQRDPIATEMLKRAAATSAKAAAARTQMAADLAAIKAKSAELDKYIAKMKDVQVALDAYLQSEKAGEKVVQDVLKQPGVQNLLGTVTDLIPKVTSTAQDIQRLIGGLGKT